MTNVDFAFDEFVSSLSQAAKDGRLPKQDTKAHFLHPAGIGGVIDNIEQGLISNGVTYVLWEHKELPAAQPVFFHFMDDRVHPLAPPWIAARLAGLSEETVEDLRRENYAAVDAFAQRILNILKESYQLEPESIRRTDEGDRYLVYASFPCTRWAKIRPIVSVSATDNNTWSVQCFVGSLKNVQDGDATLSAYHSSHVIKRSAEHDAADLSARYIQMIATSKTGPNAVCDKLLSTIAYRR